FTPTPPTCFSPLSLHDALPISCQFSCFTTVRGSSDLPSRRISKWRCGAVDRPELPESAITCPATTESPSRTTSREACPYIVSYRSEEHTSELQSRFDLVCRLLL